MTGKANQRRGKMFEQRCTDTDHWGVPGLVIKWIDRTHCRGASLPDIEIPDYPQFRIDCKFTTTEWSMRDITIFLEKCQKKYCKIPGDIPIIITGERKGKFKLRDEHIRVWFKTKYGLTTVLYSDWLKHLERNL